MNYAAIYKNFIADRQRKQPERPAYFETHHIVPKALGGGNGASNLIRLTPEDHFFAHLLLAKIHGGTLWAPIAFMLGGNRKDYKPTQSRIAHGWAARAMAKAATGAGSHQFDTATHTLVNGAGETWAGLQSEMPAALGLSKSMANMVLKGRVGVAKGWSLLGAERKTLAGERHPMHRKEARHFCHVDGRQFSGTQLEFSDAMGVPRPAVSKLANGVSKVWNGWHLRGAELPTTGRGAKWLQLKNEHEAKR